MSTTMKTPGVYVNELNAFPNSVVPVATAVPAFVGYTPTASYEGKSYLNKPTKISSFAEFQAIFCLPNPPAPAAPAKQYSPQYYLVKEGSTPAKKGAITINGVAYVLEPDPNTIYYLYNSVRWFFQNGGGDAYIVSVGSYGEPSKEAIAPGTQIVNPNVVLVDISYGFGLLKNEEEPTMYICPEATLLSLRDNQLLMQSMLAQCIEMKTAISIFDLIGARDPNSTDYMDAVTTFRNNTGNQGLSYGTAYYPFIGTNVIQSSEVDYTNLFGGDTKQLESFLSPPDAPNEAITKIFADSSTLTNLQKHNALMVASKTYAEIMKQLLSEVNVLPPSGGMAGVITTNDNEIGVWHSPANMGMVGAVSLSINLTDEEQEDLLVDPITGKSVNAIRFFNRHGILVWGARTLDGNSQDWRYLSVRRTMTYLEQSCKLAAHAYVFALNDKSTWEAVKSMLTSFLTDVWKQGGLVGANAAEAFDVQCGLGSTMTPVDILNGFLRVTVKVAVTRPAEFMVITLEQEMAKS